MNRLLNNLTRCLLRVAQQIAPPQKSEWIQAILAEYDVVEAPWQAFLWAFGAFSFACRCRLLLSLGIVRENLEMNRSSIASVAVFIAVLGLLLATPTFRDAATVVPATLNAAVGHNNIGDDELRQMATKAEQQRDAATLAFAAIHLFEPEERMRLGDQAIALDPSLSWVRYFVVKSDWHFIMHPEIYGSQIQQVIAADPDNAVVYLLRAQSIKLSDQTLSNRRPEWDAAMDKVFSAAKYDDYSDRRLKLDHEVLANHKFSPFAVADLASSRYAMVDHGSLRAYADQLIASGDTKSCARVVRFSEMLRSDQTYASDYIGQDLSHRALAVLDKNLALPLSAPKHRPYEGSVFGQYRLDGSSIADAMLVQASLLVAIASIVLVATCTVLLLLRRRKTASLPRVLRIGAAIGEVSLIVAFFAYIPFADSLVTYQRAQTAREAVRAITPLYAFDVLPYNIFSFTRTDGGLYFWSCVIALGAAVVLWRVALHLRAYAKPKPV